MTCAVALVFFSLASSAESPGSTTPQVTHARFRVPEGFVVEQVASETLTGSAIAFTFDHEGRPLIGVEGRGVRTLVDKDNDGLYDDYVELSDDLKNAQGLYEGEPGTYLIQAGGRDATGLFEVTDSNLDLKADEVTLRIQADGGMQEHGPHAIRLGPDGYLYVMYGNHVHPDVTIDEDSPSRGLDEDYLLPRYVDPRGHANSIRAPGGAVERMDTSFNRVEQFAAGFRNSYDFDFDAWGEVFTFESDMEWDIGLPWFRPVRVVHVVPGGDYGWRTGSSKKPFYYIDTLPGVDNIGRGSPVGVCFYEHNAFPDAYRGALFLGDWSRGRIRVIFPRRDGATYSGETQDFVVGEPLNVTDVDVGADGALYFTTGGRHTHGGLYRVRYTAARSVSPTASTIDGALAQPMPRSAWGNARLRATKESIGEAAWTEGLQNAARDTTRPAELRVRALELLQVLGPAPSPTLLGGLARDKSPEVRAFAAYLLGTHPLDSSREPLLNLLLDKDPMVLRRTCEAMVRVGYEHGADPTVESRRLYALLDHPDRFVRYAARTALMRAPADEWAPMVLSDDVRVRTRGALEGLTAFINSPGYPGHNQAVFDTLDRYADADLSASSLLDLLRVTQLAIIRADDGDQARAALRSSVAQPLLQRFPNDDWRVNRELQVVLAGMHTEDAIPALLDYLETSEDPAEQIHTVYALRSIPSGWSTTDLHRLVAWFDTGWTIGGGASMQGYIENLWDSTIELLPEDEQKQAIAHRDEFMAARREEAMALMAELEGEAEGHESDLTQRNFEELAEYLEYDPMAYRDGDLDRGRKVFIRSRCANCHIFGTYGNGGGPDLSTVAGRFSRRDMLEAIMYPSKVISDQYTAVNVELKDGAFYTGMVVGENSRRLTLITAEGERIDIRKRDIRDRFEANTSIMPEGLLETMTLQDLVDLIHFLENGTADAAETSNN